MPVAVSKAIMQSSGTLIGLMVGMGIQCPSLLSLMMCLSLINIELQIASPLFQAFRINRKNLYYQLLPADGESIRCKKMDATDPLGRNEKTLMKTMVSPVLLSLALYNKLRTVKNVELNDLYKKCFDISHAVCFGLVTDSSHVRSFAAIICTTVMNM